MNKGITLLLLVVVAAAMVIVVVSHINTDIESTGQLSTFAEPNGAIQVSDGAEGSPAGAEKSDAGDPGLSGGVTLPASALDNPVHRSHENSTADNAGSGSSVDAADDIAASLVGRVSTSGTAGNATAGTAANTGAAQGSGSANTSASGTFVPATAGSVVSGTPAATPAAGSATAGTKPASATTTPSSTPASGSGTGTGSASTAGTVADFKPANAGTIKNISLHFQGKGMILRIQADKPFAVKHFTLAAPNRLVVDIQGTWKGVKAPGIPSNQLVKNARLGRQGTADRIVLDLSRGLKKQELTNLDGTMAELFFE